MTLLPVLPTRLVLHRRRTPPPGPALTIGTPLSPQPPARPLVVSGTYTGTATGLDVVWRQGESTVGAPVEATFANGLWSAVLTTPAASGTYTLRATLNSSVTADSDPITIAAIASDAVATFGFEGTGLPAGTVDLFGHAFPEGAIPNGAPVVLRTAGQTTLHGTQLNVLNRWPDQSVKTALLAAELPALSDGQVLDVELLSGQAHPDPGPSLNLATLLSGRTAVVRTWAPGNTTTPLWSFDVVQAAVASSDRWHDGPLVVSTRVEQPVPSLAVQNTAGQTGIIESVRLIVDVIATKDGFLELDVCFSNDRLPFRGSTAEPTPACGIARFGYTIEIDGEIVYDQRPASGPAMDLLQWSQWIRRRARRADGTRLDMWGSSHRPFFRPDFEVLVRARVTLPYDRSITPGTGGTLSIYNNGVNRWNDPYWSWGLARAAGAGGGRPEIGYRTEPAALWLAWPMREAEIVTQRMFEAAATRPMYFRDWRLNKWASIEDYPRMSLAPVPMEFSPPGTLRRDAIGYPTGQGMTHNTTDHITVDLAHHGSYNFAPALLSGRRLAYDGLAVRVFWTSLQLQYSGSWGGSFRAVEPNVQTGIVLGMAPWGPQIRSYGWALRDYIDALTIWPESLPQRAHAEDLITASVNAWKHASETWIANWIPPSAQEVIGLPIMHAGNLGCERPWMTAFVMYAFFQLLRNRLGGPNLPEVVAKLFRARVGWYGAPTVNHRNFLSDLGLNWRQSGVWATTWEALQPQFEGYSGQFGPMETGDDWTWILHPDRPLIEGYGDYHRNRLNTLAIIAYGLEPDAAALVPLSLRAMAADALALLRSERQVDAPTRNAPAIDAANFGSVFQTNAICPADNTWQLDRAPTILPSQTFDVAGDAAVGTIVGIVRFTGPFPRNSARGRGVADAWQILSQPPGNPLSISEGGVLRVANTSALGTAPFQVTVRCRTYAWNRVSQPNVERLSTPVTLTVTPIIVAPFIAEVTQPFVVGNNAPVGAFVGQLTITGTRPYAVSIVAGDPNGLFAVDNTGRVTVAAALSGQAAGLRSLTFRVSAPGGQFDRQVPIDLQGAIFPPDIAAGQTLEVAAGEPAGTFVSPDLSISGSPPTALAIVSGNTGNRFEAVAPNRIRTTAVLNRIDAASYTLRLRATNSAGSDEENVTVAILPERWIWGNLDARFLAAYDVAQRLRPAYAGPLFRARRVADGAEQDFGSGAASVSPGDIQAFANGGRVELAALYDQSPNGQHMSTPSAHGRPFLTDASGNAFVLNGRPVVRYEGCRGFMRDPFTMQPHPDFCVFTVTRHTAWPSVSSTFLCLGDPASSGSYIFWVSSTTVGVRRQFAQVQLSASNALNTTYFVGAVTGNDPDWVRRPLRNTTLGAAGTNTLSTLTSFPLRLGYDRDDLTTDRGLVGFMGPLVLTSAIEKTQALPALRSWLMTTYGVS